MLTLVESSATNQAHSSHYRKVLLMNRFLSVMLSLVLLICASSLPALSQTLQIISPPAPNRLVVIIAVTARTEEAARKDVYRLKNDIVYTALQSLDLKPNIKATQVETKTNPDNSHTYKLIMTGQVSAARRSTGHAAIPKHSLTQPHEAAHFTIKSFSLSDTTGVKEKFPYHDIKVVVGLSDNR